MLRAVSAIFIESQSLVLSSSARRDVYKFFRTSICPHATANKVSQTVLTSDGATSGGEEARAEGAAPPPPPPPPPAPRRAWMVAVAALAATASLGGVRTPSGRFETLGWATLVMLVLISLRQVYFYRKLSDEGEARPAAGGGDAPAAAADDDDPPPVPADGELLPRRVQYLLVGAGTASFAAMRAIRSARPDAQVLLVGDEPQLPYMRPPLSKELWREPELARAADLDALGFRQWNGRRRPLAYEPAAFYAPVERLAELGHGAAVARGWRVSRLDVEAHEAELCAPGREPVRVRYDRCLLATGVRPRRAPALAAAAAAGRSLALRGVRDARRLARRLEDPAVRRVLVLGGGFLASELSASLAGRADGPRVAQAFREAAPMAAVLPPYLAAEAARRLREAGVELLPHAEVVESEAEGGGVALRLADGGRVAADLVVECVGCEPDDELARRSGLELHPQLGGLLVNAELQARADVFAAGDVACFHDVALGRRRVEHHDHAVVSGRLAGRNMAAQEPPRPYTHQSMFWSDLGPALGYEAIGIVDSSLRTVGVFCEDAVSSAASAAAGAAAEGAAQSGERRTGPADASEAADAGARRYERGVVFYLRERRVVGVLLWNLFNRMHVARQVLAAGEFDDLFEVAKLFALHEDE